MSSLTLGDEIPMASYNRYSHHARRALTHAGFLVRRFQHPRLDTGHLLVGVMLTEGSIGYEVLNELSLTATRATPHLAALTLPTEQVIESPPNDAALDIALELAEDESSWLGHHYIGTEHLLLGITRTNIGNASDLLHLMNVQPDQVRRRVRHAVSDGLTEFSLELGRRNARLSELSRRVINAAEQMSIALDHQTVGIGHLLLILAHEQRSATAALLKQSKLDTLRLELGLNERDALTLINMELVLDQAIEQAQSLGSHFTGTEHLLLALVIDTAGKALLDQYGVNTSVLHKHIEQQMRNRR
ncbi:MAG: hypothetical protein H7Y09_08285 [Chitinophagaceae bacterium]|nr:hypothetical protein [Anaerolineae bacterium]